MTLGVHRSAVDTCCIVLGFFAPSRAVARGGCLVVVDNKAVEAAEDVDWVASLCVATDLAPAVVVLE